MEQEYTSEGNKNLEITKEQSRFTRWMYDEIKPYLRGHILEIGSGVGTYSAYLVKDDRSLVLTEIDPSYITGLKKRFRKNEVYRFDMSSPRDVGMLRKRHKFDTIVFLNVLEHVEYDLRALKLVRTLLRKNGRIICLVPTHKFLYNSLDKSIRHYRRYTKEELKRKVRRSGYTVEHCFSFNVFAIPGWYISGNLLRRQVVNGSAMRAFNLLVPIFKTVERYVLFRSVGISTIIVARR